MHGIRIIFAFSSLLKYSLFIATTPELLKAFLELPEMQTVGSMQERAAFVSVHVEKRTVRDVAETIGVSKSQVPNLAALFQNKLAFRIASLDKKRVPISKEYAILVVLCSTSWRSSEKKVAAMIGVAMKERSAILARAVSAGGTGRKARGTALSDPDEWN